MWGVEGKKAMGSREGGRAWGLVRMGWRDR